MSEGKLSSEEFAAQEKQGGDSTQGISFRLGGRFKAPASSGDLSVYTPDDDVVDEVAKRFRTSLSLGSVASMESLDQQGGGDDAVDEGFLLHALETVPEPPVQQNSLPDQLLPSDTDRMEEIPLVSVEPLTENIAAAQVVAPTMVCPTCRAENPAGMSFCVECGGTLTPQGAGRKARSGDLRFGAEPIADVRREPPPATQAAKEANPWPIALVSINEDGSDGRAVALDFLETTVGREGDSRFPTDAFLSPRHARFHIKEGRLYIEDLYSLNGTFIKLRDETKLAPGDTILMGRQVLRFERFEQSITPKTKSADGTRYMGSPAPGGSFKILQIGIGGVVQNVYCLPEAGAVLGREKGDIVFPHDKFMSGRHAQIYSGDDGHCYLVDLNSSNGTWIKIWEKTALDNGDYIFMGQQLFRVHYKG